MKKTFFISFVILLSFVFCCCAKNKEKKIETTNEQVQIEKQIEQKVEISPEMKKLNIVFEKMSDRAKNEISNIKTENKSVVIDYIYANLYNRPAHRTYSTRGYSVTLVSM